MFRSLSSLESLGGIFKTKQRNQAAVLQWPAAFACEKVIAARSAGYKSRMTRMKTPGHAVIVYAGPFSDKCESLRQKQIRKDTLAVSYLLNLIAEPRIGCRSKVGNVRPETDGGV